MDLPSPVGASGSLVVDIVTPRTKIAQMLADIDAEIDNAPTPSPSRLRESKLLDLASIANATARSPAATAKAQMVSTSKSAIANGDSGSPSQDSDDDVVRPRGGVARRMLAAHNKSPQLSAPAKVAHLDDDEDEFYSVTPIRRRASAKSHSLSPVRSESGGGLFVSPAKSNDGDGDGDDEDGLPVNPLGNKEKLAELIAKKRAERLAREAEKQERQQHAASSDLPQGAYEDAEVTPQDANIEKIMSDASRPARKASKKALEEMERETQRLARQQALAHQMKVKKKFTTNDLFAKFNFRQPAVPKTPADQPTEGETTASSVPNSDGVEERAKYPHSTPPSSPPSPLDLQKDLVEKGALSKLMPVRHDSIASIVEIDSDEESPDITEIMRSPQRQKKSETTVAAQFEQPKKGLELARLGNEAALPTKGDSDDELEIIPRLPPHLRAFDKVAKSTRSTRPAESRAIHNLKHLSHVNLHEGKGRKRSSKPSVAPQALEFQLRKRAKEQARLQQLERIEELRAKGIEVQTTGEREKEAEAFENLLEKARQDAVELRKAEKAARKEAGEEVTMDASDDEDEDEDEDYVGSGSEEEGDEGDDEREQDENGLFDEAAEESDEEEEEVDVEDADLEANIDEEDEEPETGRPVQDDRLMQEEQHDGTVISRRSRISRVVQDDDDDEDNEEPGTNVLETPANTAKQDDPFAAFGFGGMDSNLLMSPTQAFNATMQTPTQATQEDSFDILRRIAPPSTSSLPPMNPDLDTQIDDDTQTSFVTGSQIPESQRITLNWETQPPETPAPARLRQGASTLSETPGWEPTQDPGLPSPWSVTSKARRESTFDSRDDHDTQSTVALRVSESPAPSQSAPKRGKLGHRRAAVLDYSDDETDALPASVKPDKRDAFREMARRRKEAMTAVERQDVEKEMRGMMEDQAEESEDEYAGLGGDDYVAPETEQDREMIDSSHVDVDERALAAHFAERQRLRDEEETSRLYKDLTTGVLRRKMGANAFDLDEDEDEVAARRRQMRQQEEARKRRALLKDENIATLAEGKQSKGKDAFLKAIADDDGDEEMGGLSDGESESVPATQDESTQQESQSQQETAPLREISGNKRKLSDDEETQDDGAPAKQRRTQASAFKRPTSLLEVQESVSFLLDEPHVVAAFGPTALELSSDSENEEQQEQSEDDDEVTAEAGRQNDGGYAPNPTSFEAKAMPPPRLPASQRRTAPKAAVVDRLSLKRGSSSSGSASSSGYSRTAWAAGPTTGGFKVPSLLRRATTSSTTSSNDRGVTTPVLSRENSGVKMGGSKKSSLAYQARAEERKAIVEASAKRRQENTAKIALMRRNSSALGRGLTGRFE